MMATNEVQLKAVCMNEKNKGKTKKKIVERHNKVTIIEMCREGS